MKNEKIHCIYGIKDLRNNKVIYIGQTRNFKQRNHDHFARKKCPIDKYIFEQGRENFEMYILKKLSDDISKEDILKMEDDYIKNYNTIESGLNKRRSGNITKDYNKYHREYNKSEKWKEYKREYNLIYRLKKKQEKQNE